MPVDPLAGVFKHRFEIDIPGGEAERCAQQLEQRGLVRAERRTYVRCFDPLDRDRTPTQDHQCSGRIYQAADRDEDDGHYQCPSCGRIVTPTLKRGRDSLRLEPVVEAMGAAVVAELRRISPEASERSRGLFRVPATNGEVLICLVDSCTESAVFSPLYPYRESLVFVVGNTRDYLRRLPPASNVYRLVDLVLGEALASFQRLVRRLIRESQVGATHRPAVLTHNVTELGVAVSNRSPAPQAVPTPEGTRWSEISIFLVDGETIAIQVPGQATRRYSHHELGLAHRRTGRPTKKWRILERLCENNGSLPWQVVSNQFNAFKGQVSGLRRVLQAQFGIPADPLPECSRAHGLRAAFRALPDFPGHEPLHSFSGLLE